MPGPELCLCKTGIMSTCSAENHQQQKSCRYFMQSSFSDRCMYLTFDEYCGCLEAQIDARDPKTSSILKANPAPHACVRTYSEFGV